MTESAPAQRARLLQITDCHLLPGADTRLLGVDTAATLDAVLRRALTYARPDVLLVTGDIAHGGKPGAYDRFIELVRTHYDGPLLTLPGNHDAGARLATAFAGQGIAAAVDTFSEFELCGWRLLAIDSHVDDQAAAELSTATRAALQAALAGHSEPTLVLLHHPLLPVGAPWLDKDCVTDGATLLEWLATQSSVRGVLFGHVHQAIDAQYQGLKLWGTPSTCFQFMPQSQAFAVDQRQPGYRWITLERDGGMSTRVDRLRDFPLTITM